MKKKIAASILICLILLFVAIWLRVRSTHANFEKMYMEKILVSDYRAAIEVATDWKKTTNNYGPAIIALANAYSLNFENQKAAFEATGYVEDMEGHSHLSSKTIGKGYGVLAYFECEAGSYELSRKHYQKVKDIYPELYDKLLPERFFCKMHELTASTKADQKEWSLFKKEISKYMATSQDNLESMSFNKAVLAHTIEDNSRALTLAKAGIQYAEKQAVRIFGDRTKIPSYDMDKMAMFYAFNGDTHSPAASLGCGLTCNADNLLQNGHDPYWLARYFVASKDIKSADTCIRYLWRRMVTEEQKKYFFRLTVENLKENGPWDTLRELDWVRKAYSDFRDRTRI